MAKNKTEISASPGGREIIITRVFDAPREKVWLAYTDPKLVAQWLGPRKLTTEIPTWEVKAGGAWQFTSRDNDGNSYSFHGYFHQVKENNRLVRTFEFDPMAGHISLETAIFEELDDKTKVTAIAVFQTPEDRDGMIQSDMESGVNEGNERLDEVLEKL